MGRSVAILDIDGTLVDTNYQHAIAWYRAFRAHGLTLPVWRIHRHIGMGGDQLVPALAGDEFAEQHGDDVRESEKGLYGELIDEVEPMDGARDLIGRLCESELLVVLASSAKEDEVDHYLELLEAREIVDAWTTSADVEATKPEPDLVHAALDSVDGEGGVMIGDTPWDVEAARRAGVGTLAVLTGGFSAAELGDAGAIQVFESVRELGDSFDAITSAARAPRGSPSEA
jgi:phosphoglycolate phosphatase-like HAD superfamily hydrolase